VTDKQSQQLIGLSSSMDKTLKSIERSLTKKEDTSKTSKGNSVGAVAGLGSSALDLAVATSKINKKGADVIVSFTEALVKVVEGIDPESLKGFDALAVGISTLTKTMKDFVMVGMAAPLILLGGIVTKKIVSMFASIGEKHKEIKQAGKAIDDLGKGILHLTLGISTLSLMLMVVPPKIIVGGAATIALYGMAVALVGKADKAVEHGSRSLRLMGLGLFAFSVGLSSFMLSLILVSIPKIIEGVAVLAAFTGVFWAMGKFEKEIATGALTLILGISVGLFLFSGALMVFGVATQTLGWEGIAMGTAVLVGLSGAMYGIGKFEKEISKGALVLDEMGVALLSIGAGLFMFGLAVQLFDWEMAAIGGSIIVGLGLAFALIGNFAGKIAPGVAAMTEIGLSLASIAGGILLFGIAIKALKSIFEDDLAEAGVIAGAIIIGLGLAFAGVGVVAGIIAPGAAAMKTVGFALMSISGGIMLLGLAIRGLKEIFGDDLAEAGIIAGTIIGGLGLAFAAMGFVAPFIVVGASAGIIMGLSLASISFGLWTFGNTIKGLYDKNLIDKDGNMKGIGVLSQMMSEFASMFFTSIFALPGIVATIGMGVSLIVISKGLTKAAEIVENLPGGFMDKLFKKDVGIIDVMAQGFKRIGQDYGGGFLGNFLGADSLSLGIRTVKGMGKALSEVAGGIASFANFDEFPILKPNPKDPSKLIYGTANIFNDIIPKIQENLPSLLTALADVFGGIGGGWFGEDSPVKKGIDAVAGMGSVLSELAGGIVAFANFSKFPVQIPSEDGSKLIYTTVDLYAEVDKMTTALMGDGSVAGGGILFSLAKVFAKIGEKYAGGFFSDNKVKEGINAVSGIGSVISELAQGILDFAEIDRGLPIYDKDGKPTGKYKKIDLLKVNDTITKILTTLPTAFSKVDMDMLEEAQEKAKKYKPITKLVSEMTGFNYADASTGMDSFGKSLVALGTSFATFSNGFASFADQLSKFEKFENTMSRLIKGQHKYKFSLFAKDMGTFKTAVNAFDVEKLKFTESMMKSIAIISKSPGNVASTINGTLEAAFKELIDVIKKLIPERQESSGVTSTSMNNDVLEKVTALFQANSGNNSDGDNEQMIAALMKTMTSMQQEISQLNLKFVNGSNGGILITDI